jgi:hypothetical protein
MMLPSANSGKGGVNLLINVPLTFAWQLQFSDAQYINSTHQLMYGNDPAIWESEDRKIPHEREVNTPRVTSVRSEAEPRVGYWLLSSEVFTILGFSDGRITITDI